MDILSQSAEGHDEQPVPLEEIVATRRLIADKLRHLPLVDKYHEPPREVHLGDTKDLIIAALTDQITFGEIDGPGAHEMRREAEFLLPDGNRLALRQTYYQTEDEDFTDDDNREEWYQAFYLAPTSTDSKGRVRYTEQKFDFSMDGNTEIDPNTMTYSVWDGEHCPPGVLPTFYEMGTSPKERYEVHDYNRLQHDWISEVIRGVEPGQQVAPADSIVFNLDF